jgi:hypothetical protein
MVAVKRIALPPLAKHLRHWEMVCRYIDSQPYRSIAHPFPIVPRITPRLLKCMATFRQ